MNGFELVTRIDDPLPSPARLEPPALPTIRVGAVQCAWSADRMEHMDTLERGVQLAAAEGAQVVCLQELTLSPYFAVDADMDDALERFGEDVESGPTASFARDMARRYGVAVHASLYERAAQETGFNTAICVEAKASLSPGRARSTFRASPAITRTAISLPATPAFPWSRSPARASASRRAGISGSPS
jgi:N-carbamoylputrescine amidase